MSDPLDVATSELLARLEKQRKIVAHSGPTHEIGGIARASALLENLMLLALENIAAAKGTTADGLCGLSMSGGFLARRATGGQLVRILARLVSDPAASRPCVRLLVREAALHRSRNRIQIVVEVRNEVIHGDQEPASARAALAALGTFIKHYRRDAGW